MKYLSIEEVVAIHYEVVRVFGGSQGVRDFGLLHSAVERPKSSFGGEDLYVSVFDKAAALLHSLLLNHPFLDGNKRTAYVCAARFLILHGYALTSDTDVLISYILEIEREKPTIKSIAAWIKAHSKRQK